MLPNSIVVGIANVDRKRDFTFPTTTERDKKDFPTTGKSNNFINFIGQELQQFVDKNYKTTAVKTIIGQSLVGLLATEILYTKPALFTNYIIVSPSLWWDNESLLLKHPNILNSDVVNPVSVFIAVGKEGAIIEADSKKLVDILKSGNKKMYQFILNILLTKTMLLFCITLFTKHLKICRSKKQRVWPLQLQPK